MRTILFMTPQMIVGGSERYILEKAGWLQRHGHRAVVVSRGGPWEGEVEKLGGRHHTVGFIDTDPYLYNRSGFLANLVRLHRIVREEGVSLIEANPLAPAMWGYHLSKLYGVPYLINVLSGHIYYQGKSNYLGLLRELDRKGLYFNSETSNRLIEERKRVRLRNCVEIPIPVRALRDSPLAESAADPFILTVCRMSPEKLYVKALIRDFGRLAAERGRRGLRLVVVGDGPLFQEVEALARKVNQRLSASGSRVELRGTVVGPELDALFDGCLFYVGMGTTLLHAARAGKCAVLATGEKRHLHGSPGYFGEDPHASIGFKFEGMRLASFHERMRRLLDDAALRARLAEKAFQTYRARFETEAVMQAWVAAYDRVIAGFDPTDSEIYQEDAVFYFLKGLKHRLLYRTELGHA